MPPLPKTLTFVGSAKPREINFEYGILKIPFPETPILIHLPCFKTELVFHV